jgi:plasmid maintenance system antidote protein VapI
MEQKKFSSNRLAIMINEALDKNAITHSDLAIHLGVSEIYIEAVLSGARNIVGLTPDILRKLASFLGISIVEIFILSGMLRKEDLYEHPIF